MIVETISREDNVLIRRMILEPGQATHWHSDSCRRISVVVRGSSLAIEFRDDSQIETVAVHPGLAEWNEPEPRTHRAINTGTETFEEVVIFSLDRPGQDPQPSSVVAETVP